MMAIEVEMKFRLPHPQELRQTLAAVGASFVRSAHQEDHYFNHPSRDFAHTDEAFRLRRDDDILALTYKGPKMDKTTKTRREIELPVGQSADDLPRLREMLLALGFKSVAVVQKHRDYWKVPWNTGDIEVVLDQVDKLGTFVELEATAHPETLEAMKSAVLTLASQLGLTESIRESYLEMLLGRQA